MLTQQKDNDGSRYAPKRRITKAAFGVLTGALMTGGILVGAGSIAYAVPSSCTGGPAGLSNDTGPGGVTGVSYTVVGPSGTRTLTALEPNGVPLVFPGDTVTTHFTVPSQCAGEQLSLASYQTPAAQFNPLASQTVTSQATGTFAAGPHTLTDTIPGPSGLLTFGASSMEGNLVAEPGDFLSVGYDFTIPGSHPDTTVSVLNPVMTFPYRCTNNNNGPVSGSLVTSLPGLTSIDDPVGSSDWFPSGDQNSPLVFQGVITVGNVCNGGPIYMNYGGNFGATFSAQVTATGTNPSQIHFRFHYRDPRARGNGNVDCANAAAPLADSPVCGASWSSTNGVTPVSNYQFDFVSGPVLSVLPPFYGPAKIDAANG